MKTLVVDQPELVAELDAQRTEHARGHRPRIRGEEQRLARRRRKRLELLLGEELGDRRADLPRLVADHVGKALRAELLRALLERRDLGARVDARHAEEPHRVGAREDAELGAARGLGGVLDLEREAHVGLVRAEAPVGLGEGHVRERPRDLDAEALAPDGGERLLHQQEQLVAVGERHLHVELRDLLDAVGAEILVAEADRDLVVAVEAGDHRQLLQELRALRQREERSLVEAARHDEVAGALGGRLVEDRRLDVEEARRLHLAADDPDHLRAEPDVALQLVAPEVEPAVAQAQRLVDVLLVELERQRRRARDDAERRHLDLDGAGRQVRVDGVGCTGDDLALGLEDELVADLLRELRRFGRMLGVDHELRDPGAVAEIDEDEPAVVASARRPAGRASCACRRAPREARRT